MFDDGVLRFGQNRTQRLAAERLHVGQHRQTTHQLGDQTERFEVLRHDVLHQVRAVDRIGAAAAVSHRPRVEPLGDLAFDAVERAAADEEDVACVDLYEFLVGMLAPALRRNVDRRPFENFQQRLLHPFARDVARDGGVVAFAGDLVDLVDEDDAPFGGRHVVGSDLQQPREDALHVLAHVAGFGEHRCVDDGEGHVQQPCDGARHKRLARTRGADQHDVRLVDLDLRAVGRLRKDAFVVVVDRYRQIAFGRLLTDDVFVQKRLDLRGLEQLLVVQRRLRHRRHGGERLGDHVMLDQRMVALFDAFVADAGAAAALKEHQHLAVVFAAEGAVLFRGM